MKKSLTVIWASLASLTLLLIWIMSLQTTAFAGVASTPPPTIPPLLTPTPQPVCPPSCDYLKEGNGYFIAKLKVPFQRESSLSAEQVKAQRSSIRAAQVAIEATIDEMRTEEQWRRYVEIAYESSPYIQFRGDETVLKQLLNSPLVERIYIDQPFSEVYGMELDDVNIDLEAIYDKKLLEFPHPLERCRIFTCEQIIERAKSKGAVYLDIVLKFKYQRQPAEGLNSKYYSQNAVIRQAQHKFFKSAMGQTILFDYPSASSFVVSGYVNSSSVKFLLDSPLVSYIVDHTDTTYQNGSQTDPINPNVIAIPSSMPNDNIKHVGSNFAWGVGLEGDGKKIIVVDTGVERSLAAFAGGTKVYDGSCNLDATPQFGTPGGCYEPTQYSLSTKQYPGKSLYAKPCIVTYTPVPASPTGSPTFIPNTATPTLIPTSDCNHGSAVSSIINGDAVISGTHYLGLAQNSFVYPFRSGIAGHQRVHIRANLKDASIYVIANSSTVSSVSISIQGRNGSQSYLNNNCDLDDGEMKGYIDDIVSKDIPFFAITGNSSSVSTVNLGGAAVPACFSNAIQVGGVEPIFSSGSELMYDRGDSSFRLTFVAPAYGFVAYATPFNTYNYHRGTSYAAPLVAAAYSILRQKYPSPQHTMNDVLKIMADSGVAVKDTRTNAVQPIVKRISLEHALMPSVWKVNVDTETNPMLTPTPTPTATATSTGIPTTLPNLNPMPASVCVPFRSALETNNNNNCTLREAISRAKSGDTIIFDFDFASGPKEILVTSEIRSDSKSLTFVGPGPGKLTIRMEGTPPPLNGGPVKNVILYFAGNDTYAVNVSGITFINAVGGSIAMEAYAQLTINNCVFKNNGVTEQRNNISPVTMFYPSHLVVNNSAFLDNRAEDTGGGIYSLGLSTIVRSSLFKNNRANNSGGAIHATSYLAVVNSTIVDNTASNGQGGGVAGAIFHNQGTMYIENSTIVNNVADTSVGGIQAINQNTPPVFRNTILSMNYNNLARTSVKNCSMEAASTSVGSLQWGESTSPSCGTTIPSLDPLLQPSLQYNGGYTDTIALQANSPAHDLGSVDVCFSARVRRDQRGSMRSNPGGYCDSGAVESVSPMLGANQGRFLRSQIGVHQASGLFDMWLPLPAPYDNAPNYYYAFGCTDDTPVVGDWNGDGVDTAGVLRFVQQTGCTTSGTQAYFVNTNSVGGNPAASYSAGLSWANLGDIPLSGRWKPESKYSYLGVYRPSTSNFIFSPDPVNASGTIDTRWTTLFGLPGDKPIVGDWNGDGIDTPGIYRPSTGEFRLINYLCQIIPPQTYPSCFLNYSIPFQQGALALASTFILYDGTGVALKGAEWQPVAGDWNGDGLTDVGLMKYVASASCSTPPVGSNCSNDDHFVLAYNFGQTYLVNTGDRSFKVGPLPHSLATPDKPFAGVWGIPPTGTMPAPQNRILPEPTKTRSIPPAILHPNATFVAPIPEDAD